MLYSQAERIRDDHSRREKDPKKLIKTYRELQYRMQVMSSANKILDMMKVPRPEGQTCCEFDYDWKFREDYALDDSGVNEKQEWKDFKENFANCGGWGFFIWQSTEICPTWRYFTKGGNYLEAAFYLSRDKIDEDTMRTKIGTACKIMEEEFVSLAEMVKEDYEVIEHRLKLVELREILEKKRCIIPGRETVSSELDQCAEAVGGASE